MASTTVTVGTRVGLHARPATMIANAASKFQDAVWLTLVGQDTEPADAASSLMIMALGAESGDEVRVESADQRAVDEVAGMIARDLDAS